MNSTLQTAENRPAAASNGSAQPVRYITPPSNIWETADGFILQVEMPGVPKEGLELTVEKDELTITGRRGAPQVQADVVYRESRPFDYRRVFELDPSIDTEKVSARMEQGILTLTLPKAERVKPRRIEVTD